MKVIERPNEKLVTVCDEEIMETVLLSNNVKIKPTKKFYGTELVNQKELLDALRNCTSANVIGTNIVNFMIQKKLIHERSVLWLKYPDKKGKVGHAILIR